MSSATNNRSSVQVLQALAFIHQRNIVHLNLMPYNLLFSNLNSDLGLKLIDFGHALELEEGSEGRWLESLQGTVEYSSPEVCPPVHPTNHARSSPAAWSPSPPTCSAWEWSSTPSSPGASVPSMRPPG